MKKKCFLIIFGFFLIFNENTFAKEANVEPDNKIFFKEDFSSIEEGLVPENWIVENDILVKVTKKQRFITSNLDKKKDKITITKIDFPENFRIDIKANLGFQTDIYIKLSEHLFGFDNYEHAGRYTTKYIINKSIVIDKKVDLTREVITFSILKKGKVLKILVNNKVKNVARIPEFENPKEMEITFTDSENGFYIYEIEGFKL